MWFTVADKQLQEGEGRQNVHYHNLTTIKEWVMVKGPKKNV